MTNEEASDVRASILANPEMYSKDELIEFYFDAVDRGENAEIYIQKYKEFLEERLGKEEAAQIFAKAEERYADYMTLKYGDADRSVIEEGLTVFEEPTTEDLDTYHLMKTTDYGKEE